MAVEIASPLRVGTAPVTGTRSPASTTTDPSAVRPASVPRRIAAWCIDFALVALATGVIGSTQSERLAAGPLPLPDPASTGPYVTMIMGDTVHRWSGGGLWITLASTLVATLVVTTLIPTSAGGSTPGLRILGLRVTATDGTPATMGQHFVRTVFGLVDLAPWVAPGLLGWLLAARSPRRQRLGDRAARTMVIGIPTQATIPTRTTIGDTTTGETATGDTKIADPGVPEVASAVHIEPKVGRDAARGSAERPPTPRHRAPAPVPALPPALAGPAPTPVQASAPILKLAPVPTRTPAATAPDRTSAAASPIEAPRTTYATEPGARPDRDAPSAEPSARHEHPDQQRDQAGAEKGAEEKAEETPEETPEGRGRQTNEENSLRLEPVWDDIWKAWVIADTTTGKTFRHDPESDSWHPVP